MPIRKKYFCAYIIPLKLITFDFFLYQKIKDKENAKYNYLKCSPNFSKVNKMRETILS